MKSPTKGNYNPDFFESGCSINFPNPDDPGLGPSLRALRQVGMGRFTPESHTPRSRQMRSKIESECSDVSNRRGNGGNISSHLVGPKSRTKSSSSKSGSSLLENKHPAKSKHQERMSPAGGSSVVSSRASMHTESASTPRTASVISGYIKNSATPVSGQSSLSIPSADSELAFTLEDNGRSISHRSQAPYTSYYSDNRPRSLASRVSIMDNSSSGASYSDVIPPGDYEPSGCSSTPHSSPVIGMEVLSGQEVTVQEKMINTKDAMRNIPKPGPSESPTKSQSFNKFKQIPTGTSMHKLKNDKHGRQDDETTEKNVKEQEDGRDKGMCKDTLKVANKGGKMAVKTGKEAKKKAKPTVAKANEKDVEVKLTALERRKAYEAKIKERKKKAESKMNVKNQGSEPSRGKIQKNITDSNTRKMEGKKSKQPDNKVNVADCYYEDDFESDDEEIRLPDPRVFNSKKAEARYQGTQDEEAVASGTAANRRSDRLNGDDGDFTEKIPFLNILTPREVQDIYQDMYYGNNGQMSGRANPNSARTDVDIEYVNPQQIAALKQSGYTYSQYENTRPMARDMHREYGHGTMGLDYNQATRRNTGQEDIPQYENGQYFAKPNPRKKTTVGYVPGYGAVKVPMNSRQADVKKRNIDPSYVVYNADGTVSSRPKKNVVGYVPGYGPVRGVSVPRGQQVPSRRVQLPPVNPNQSWCPFHGLLEDGKPVQGRKKTVDVLESRAKAKPFNTYVDDEASRRFERQFAKHY
ncbi:uncharacterized protein LOC134278358 [Saccostrea cucullata]|uniref:uncharacterized protein LOC134278358 n=1 Tax=Saccostrea cuccullata TaxID=36930 RepID=UPI002ED19F69